MVNRRYEYGFTAPGLGSPRTPAAQPIPARAAASRAAPSSEISSPVQVIDWRPSTLRGPQALDIGGKKFRLPITAQVKVRGSVALVLGAGVVRVLSSRGEGVLLQGEARRLASIWSEL